MHVFRRPTESFIQQNDANADHAADSNQAPIDVARDHAFAERRNQTSLRRRKWMRTQIRTRRANKTVSVIDQIEHWRNHKRSRDHTDDERDLLLPWRRIDQLAGLQ